MIAILEIAQGVREQIGRSPDSTMMDEQDGILAYALPDVGSFIEVNVAAARVRVTETGDGQQRSLAEFRREQDVDPILMYLVAML